MRSENKEALRDLGKRTDEAAQAQRDSNARVVGWLMGVFVTLAVSSLLLLLNLRG
jgi:predicted benzoate:H+ symporter BenE